MCVGIEASVPIPFLSINVINSDSLNKEGAVVSFSLIAKVALLSVE